MWGAGVLMKVLTRIMPKDPTPSQAFVPRSAVSRRIGSSRVLRYPANAASVRDAHISYGDATKTIVAPYR